MAVGTTPYFDITATTVWFADDVQSEETLVQVSATLFEFVGKGPRPEEEALLLEAIRDAWEALENQEGSFQGDIALLYGPWPNLVSSFVYGVLPEDFDVYGYYDWKTKGVYNISFSQISTWEVGEKILADKETGLPIQRKPRRRRR